MTTRDMIDDVWANGEQPKVIRNDMLLSKETIWQGDVNQEEVFTKTDLDSALRKVSRKVK